MKENRNTNPAAVAEDALDAIRKMLDTVGDEQDLKTKLEELVTDLSGKLSAEKGDRESEGTPSPDKAAADDASAETPEEEADAGADEDDDDDDDDDVSTGEELSDLFNEDVVAGLAIGFVAGAALVGGGVLLHKLVRGE